MTRKLSPGVHNVRIKGKLRKVKVLASGQWRFMKGKVKKTVKKVTKRKTKKARKTKTKAKKQGRRMGFSLRSIFKWIRIGSFVAPALIKYSTLSGTPIQKVGYTLQAYAGLDWRGKFNWATLGTMWMPLIITTLVTYGIPKIGGIIRSFK